MHECSLAASLHPPVSSTGDWKDLSHNQREWKERVPAPTLLLLPHCFWGAACVSASSLLPEAFSKVDSLDRLHIPEYPLMKTAATAAVMELPDGIESKEYRDYLVEWVQDDHAAL